MSMFTIILIAIGIAAIIAGAHFALILAIKPRNDRVDHADHNETNRG